MGEKGIALECECAPANCGIEGCVREGEPKLCPNNSLYNKSLIEKNIEYFTDGAGI